MAYNPTVQVQYVDGRCVVLEADPVGVFYLPKDYHRRTVQKQQRELDEIYLDSQGLTTSDETYRWWRKEYERAGKQYAFDRMMLLYNPSEQEEQASPEEPGWHRDYLGDLAFLAGILGVIVLLILGFVGPG